MLSSRYGNSTLIALLNLDLNSTYKDLTRAVGFKMSDNKNVVN